MEWRWLHVKKKRGQILKVTECPIRLLFQKSVVAPPMLLYQSSMVTTLIRGYLITRQLQHDSDMYE